MINWKNRYTRLLADMPELNDPALSILEIGAGNSGIARYLNRPVFAVDRYRSTLSNTGPLATAATIEKLPFATSGMDIVICLDTLEHLPREQRIPAIKELARVSRRRLVIGAPMGSFAAWGDEQYWLTQRWRGMRSPDWLDEHLLNGIPSLAEMLEAVAELDLPFQLKGNETLIQHYAGLLADEIPFLANAHAAIEHKRTVAPPVGPGDGDVYYSYVFDIDTALPPATVAGQECAQLLADEADSSQNAIDLYCVGHKPACFHSFSGLTNFFVGNPTADLVSDKGMVFDDAEISIKAKNASFSELTAIYSIWQNRRYGKFVGFCHYRRYFNFLAEADTPRVITLTAPDQLAKAKPSIEASDRCRSIIEKGGFVVSAAEALTPNIAEHYMRYHHSNHYLQAINILAKRHPHLRPYAFAQFSVDRGHTNNMFICSANAFERLCSWWFDLLFTLEENLDAKSDLYQNRFPAFLSERLLDIYLRWQAAQGVPIHEQPIFFLSDSAFSLPEATVTPQSAPPWQRPTMPA